MSTEPDARAAQAQRIILYMNEQHARDHGYVADEIAAAVGYYIVDLEGTKDANGLLQSYDVVGPYDTYEEAEKHLIGSPL